MRGGFVALAAYIFLSGAIEMFCPSCGMENAQGQKFCRRCGTHLLALQAASEMLTDMAQGQAANQLDPKFVLKLVAFLGSFGFMAITGGAIALTAIQVTSAPDGRGLDGPPLGIVLAMAGYPTLVWLCRILMKWASPAHNKPALPMVSQPVAYMPPVNQVSAVGANTNPTLNAAPAYQSIIEDETRQFAKQPQNK
jgi:hypothetical protein